MYDWERHTYRKRLPRPSVQQGTATLKNVVEEAEPVHNVPIAGFARPLPEKESDHETV